MDINEIMTLPTLYDFKNKNMCVSKYTKQMLNRISSMFEYTGLEDLIDLRQLELIVKTAGAVGIKKIGDKYEILRGGFGGEMDSKYRPTLWVGANPGLKECQSYSFKVFYGDNDVSEEDGVVVITNDTMLEGVLPIINRYASMLAENDITMKIALLQSRMIKNFITQDDDTALSVKEYIKQIDDGEMGVITSSFLDENERVISESTAANNTITNLIELQQYLKASLYNEFGLNANYNMKRESISAGESQLNFDALLPMVEDMLHCRERGIELLNQLYGTDFKVELHGVWKDLQLAHEQGNTLPVEADSSEISPVEEDLTNIDEDTTTTEMTQEEAVKEPVQEEPVQEVVEEVVETIEEVVETIKEEIKPIEEDKEDEISD